MPAHAGHAAVTRTHEAKQQLGSIFSRSIRNFKSHELYVYVAVACITAVAFCCLLARPCACGVANPPPNAALNATTAHKSTVVPRHIRAMVLLLQRLSRAVAAKRCDVTNTCRQNVRLEVYAERGCLPLFETSERVRLHRLREAWGVLKRRTASLWGARATAGGVLLMAFYERMDPDTTA